MSLPLLRRLQLVSIPCAALFASSTLTALAETENQSESDAASKMLRSTVLQIGSIADAALVTDRRTSSPAAAESENRDGKSWGPHRDIALRWHSGTDAALGTPRPSASSRLVGLARDNEIARRRQQYGQAYASLLDETQYPKDLPAYVKSRDKTWDDLIEKAEKRLLELDVEQSKLEGDIEMWKRKKGEFDEEHREACEKAAEDETKRVKYEKYFALETDELDI